MFESASTMAWAAGIGSGSATGQRPSWSSSGDHDGSLWHLVFDQARSVEAALVPGRPETEDVPGGRSVTRFLGKPLAPEGGSFGSPYQPMVVLLEKGVTTLPALPSSCAGSSAVAYATDRHGPVASISNAQVVERGEARPGNATVQSAWPSSMKWRLQTMEADADAVRDVSPALWSIRRHQGADGIVRTYLRAQLPAMWDALTLVSQLRPAAGSGNDAVIHQVFWNGRSLLTTAAPVSASTMFTA